MPKHGNNIRKRKDGRWEGRYKYLCSDNSYKYKSVYGKTCSEVKEKLEVLIIQQSTHLTLETKDDICIQVSLEWIAERWLENIKQMRKYSTYVKYRGTYEKYIKKQLAWMDINEISNGIISERLFQDKESMQYSQNLKYRVMAIINQILKFANESYRCNVTQLTNKGLKDKGKKIEIINHTEQASLLRYLYVDMDSSKAGILLCLKTGLRLGEICSLKWKDIDFDQQIIHIRRTVQRIARENGETKTMLMVSDPKSVFSIREIPISNHTVGILRKILHDGDYVIGGKKPLEPRTYENRFKKYSKESAISDYNFHVLRHTFATNCIDNGMDVKSLSEILGHSDVQITLNRYVHPTIEAKRKQLAVLDSVYGQYCGQGN